MTTAEIEQELQLELVEKEEILWAGQPESGIIFKRSDIFTIPFSLLWFGVMLAVFINACAVNKVSFFTTYTGAFVIAGIFMVVGRFFYDSKRRSKIMYAITATRIIIKSNFLIERFNIYDIASVPDIVLFERNNGSGTILLSDYFSYFFRINNFKRLPKLEDISDVKNVFNLLIKLRKQILSNNLQVSVSNKN